MVDIHHSSSISLDTVEGGGGVRKEREEGEKGRRGEEVKHGQSDPG